MIPPQVDQKDIDEIERIISDIFIRSPRNSDGTMRPQIVFRSEERGVLVATVLRELGHRDYAVMKPEEEDGV